MHTKSDPFKMVLSEIEVETVKKLVDVVQALDIFGFCSEYFYIVSFWTHVVYRIGAC